MSASGGAGPSNTGAPSDRNQEATIWVGGLEPQVTEQLLHELFINAGPVVSVHIPKDKITGAASPFAFVEFASPADADYAIRVFAAVRLYGRPLRLNRAAADKHSDDQYHARLFIGNLDPSVDEKQLYDTFSQFGALLSARVMMQPPANGAAGAEVSRGFGFVLYDSFVSADAAMAAMQGQYLGGKPVHVSYAFKQGSQGERHGSEAERELERRSREKRGVKDVRPLPGVSLAPQQQQQQQQQGSGSGMGMGMGMRSMPPPPLPSSLPPPPIPSAYPFPYGMPPPPMPGMYGGYPPPPIPGYPPHMPPPPQMPPGMPPGMPPFPGMMMPPPPFPFGQHMPPPPVPPT